MSRREGLRRLTHWVIFAVAPMLACHDTSATFAIRNATSEAITVRVETVRRTYEAYDCEGKGERVPGPSRAVAPGTRLCFEGPVQAEEYVGPDDVSLIHVERGGETCFERRAPLAELFPAEGYHPTFKIDDATCPPPNRP